MNSKSGPWITLAVFLSLSSGVTRLSAEAIEASTDGTPIDLSAQKLGESATLNRGDSDTEQIRVEGTAGQQASFHLFDIDAPVIDSDGYAVFGEVRYESVEGDGFLEMWNHMPAEKGGKEIGASFFSRTMAVSGPMSKLTGSSEWRRFQLPAFINDGSGRRPLKLTLNVVLPGEGVVEVRDLKLQTLQTPAMGMLGFGTARIALIGFFAFLLGTIVVGLVWFLKKRQAESELRRIQAFDS